MEYTKIKITSKDDAKRFYRVLAVQGDPDLYVLGALIGESLQVDFEHAYMFVNKQGQYVFDEWVEDHNYFSLVKDFPMSEKSSIRSR